MGGSQSQPMSLWTDDDKQLLVTSVITDPQFKSNIQTQISSDPQFQALFITNISADQVFKDNITSALKTDTAFVSSLKGETGKDGIGLAWNLWSAADKQAFTTMVQTNTDFRTSMLNLLKSDTAFSS